MSEVFVATCFECDWYHCDFSEKDEKKTINDAEDHYNETGHSVSVNKRINTTDFENIKTFERKE